MLRLIISKTEPLKYTIADIISNDYPELWNRVCRQESRLASLQSEIAKALPESKRRLVKSIEELAESREAQLDLQHYLTLRALYIFAHNVWFEYYIGLKRPHNLYDLCDKLASASKGEDLDTETDLTELLSKLEGDNLEALLNQGNADALVSLAKIAEPHDIVCVVSKWSLNDIIGTKNLCNPDLLSSALAAQDFAGANIGEIASDNKLKRIY